MPNIGPRTRKVIAKCLPIIGINKNSVTRLKNWIEPLLERSRYGLYVELLEPGQYTFVHRGAFDLDEIARHGGVVLETDENDLLDEQQWLSKISFPTEKDALAFYMIVSDQTTKVYGFKDQTELFA